MTTKDIIMSAAIKNGNYHAISYYDSGHNGSLDPWTGQTPKEDENVRTKIIKLEVNYQGRIKNPQSSAQKTKILLKHLTTQVAYGPEYSFTANQIKDVNDSIVTTNTTYLQDIFDFSLEFSNGFFDNFYAGTVTWKYTLRIPWPQAGDKADVNFLGSLFKCCENTSILQSTSMTPSNTITGYKTGSYSLSSVSVAKGATAGNEIKVTALDDLSTALASRSWYKDFTSS